MQLLKRKDQQIRFKTKHPAYSYYLYTSIVLGLVILVYSISQLFYLDIGFRWLILAAITILTSSYSIKIPSINAKISIGDTLYFTNLLLYGIPVGVLTAALDGMAGSLRSHTRRRRLRYTLFNLSAMACSAFLSGNIFYRLVPESLLLGGFAGALVDLLIPLGILAFSHYLLNSGFVALIVALEKRKSFIRIWMDGFLWTSITYFAGVSAATFIAAVIGDITPQVLGVAVPVLLAVYYTYKTYLKKVDEVRSLALYDSLTGLPNRISFKEQLEEALLEAEQQEHMLAVMFLDLDHFKRINDSYGHGTGDRVLRHVSSQLAGTARIREKDHSIPAEDQDIVIGRFGGDEFTILAKNILCSEDATRLAERFLKNLSDPYLLDDHELDVGATIGISIYPFDGTNADTLLRNADTALYYAKDNGRNICNLYLQSMNYRSSEKLSMESQLRRALDRQEFEIYYQPKMDVKSWKISGAEALIRWNHPTKGLLPPKQFIELAEETGLIRPMGEWVLKTVCNQMMTWQRDDVNIVPVAVNLSPLQFRQTNLINIVDKTLKETSLDPSCLELELTESAIMESEQRSETSLGLLRRLGVKISIDDFGTGYSSLSRLKSLRLDGIKIDRVFIKDCVQSPDDKAIIAAIIAMAQSLGLKVVAEGVETEQQLTYLWEQGCSEVQGFYFYKPVSAMEFCKVLRLNNDSLPEIGSKTPLPLQIANQTKTSSNQYSPDFVSVDLRSDKRIVLVK